MKYSLGLLFIFYSINIQAQNAANMKNIENSHFLEIMEEISLDVMSERFIGELEFKAHSEFETECLKRLNSKYTQKEITRLKENIPPNYIAPFKNNIEILKDLIEFNKKIFIPKTSSLRKQLQDQMIEEERKNLAEIRNKYLMDLIIYINAEKEKILNNNDLTEIRKENRLEELNLTLKLYKVNPVAGIVWKKENEQSKYLSTLGQKYIKTLDQYGQQYADLKKQWFKIRIGRLGNFLGAFMSFENDKDKLKTSYLFELLLIK